MYTWVYNKLNVYQPPWQFWDSGGVKLESLCNFSIVGCQWTVNCLLGGITRNVIKEIVQKSYDNFLSSAIYFKKQVDFSLSWLCVKKWNKSDE